MIKVDSRINGKIILELTPDNELERLILREIHDGAEKGKSITVGAVGVSDIGAISLSMERK